MVSKASADRVMAMCADAIKRGASYALAPTQQQALVTPGIVCQRDARALDSGKRRCSVRSRWSPRSTPSTKPLNSPTILPSDCRDRCSPAISASAFRFVDDFDVGAMWINEASRFRLDLYPFGGVKQSGVGREGIRYAIDEMSQIKFIGIRP